MTLCLEPEFSPDGMRIAFASDRSGKGSELWVSNRDGTNLTCLTRGWEGIVSYPRWSPCNRWITFHVHKAYVGWNVYVIDSNGGPPRRLTPEGSNEQRASWSQDGRWIYFNSKRGDNYEVCRRPWEGGEIVQVTHGGGGSPVESADGKTLYFERGPRLMAQTLASGEERQILKKVEFGGWAVFADGVYYLAPFDGRFSSGFEVRFWNFTRQTDEVLHRSELKKGLGLTVSPDRKTILVIASVTAGADLMLVENFR